MIQHKCSIGEATNAGDGQWTCSICGEPIVDALVEAAIDLEVAVDEYTATAWSVESKSRNFGYTPGSSTKAEDAAHLSKLGAAVVNAATAVAMAMIDAEVHGSTFAEIIPPMLRDAAADAEIRAMRKLPRGTTHLCPEMCDHDGKCAAERDAISAMEHNAEMAIERYYEGGWDTTGEYAAELNAF
jgi:hypothetical protein